VIMACDMPNSGFNDTLLVALFNALSQNPSRHLGSLGILMHAPNTPKGKLSWQIATGFGCPQYIYAYADPSIYPTFLGYCTGAGNLAYQGTDWGLADQEVDLLLTNPKPGRETFLPIHPLLGELILTTEQSLSCDGVTVYGATFAEQSLVQLDNALQSIDSQNLMFIMESDTGYLVTASISNQTTTANGTRILARAAPNPDIASIAAGTPSSDWAVYQTSYQIGSTIKWTLVTAVPTRGFLASLRQASGASIGWSLGVIFVLVILTGLGYYFSVGRPMRQLLEDGTDEEHESFITEVQLVSELKNKKKKVPKV